jgi:hypothetical protein
MAGMLWRTVLQREQIGHPPMGRWLSHAQHLHPPAGGQDRERNHHIRWGHSHGSNRHLIHAIRAESYISAPLP